MIIDQLPEISTIEATDELPIERGTTSYKTPISKISAKLQSDFAATSSPNKDGTASAGSASKFSRGDHVHPLNVASSGTPAMDGTASRGSAATYARSDHVHPTDTSRLPASQIDGLFVDLGTVYSELTGTGGLLSAITAKSTGDFLVARTTAGFSQTFFNATITAYGTVLFIFKASSNNAYFFAFSRGFASVGNISIANSTVSLKVDLQ